MDWQALIQRLRDGENGMTLAQIAEAVEAPISTISDLARGASQEPRGSLAVRLMAIKQPHKPKAA